MIGEESLTMWMLTSFVTKGIKHEFLAPRTPQQNEVAKRKNKVLEKMA